MSTQTTITTGEARLSYVHIWEPYAADAGQDPKYSVTLLIPKTDTATKAKIDAAIAAATADGVNSKWGGRMPATVFSPVYDGDGVRPNGERFGAECAGHWVFTASSKNTAPGVVDRNRNAILDKAQVYSGCYGRASITFFAYASPARKGIGCGLNHVQKLRDGDPLGGARITADQAFADDVAVDEFGLPVQG